MASCHGNVCWVPLGGPQTSWICIAKPSGNNYPNMSSTCFEMGRGGVGESSLKFGIGGRAGGVCVSGEGCKDERYMS